MSTYCFVEVHDWYDSFRFTRIRCLCKAGNYYCSRRQKRDAFRRVRVMPGSVLRSVIYQPILVTDDDGFVVDHIPGA